MTAPDWVHRLKTAAETQGRGADIYKSMLAELLDLFLLGKKSLPPATRQKLQAIRTLDFERAVDEAKHRIERGNFSFPLPTNPQGDAEGTMLALGAQIRALDQALHEASVDFDLRLDFGPAQDPSEHYRVRTSHNEAFIIPRFAARPLALQKRVGPFRNSLLVYHRILPLEVAGIKVGLKPGGEVFLGGNASSLVYGAGLFPDLKFKWRPLPHNRFVIDTVKCGSGKIDAVIESHVEKAYQEKCRVLEFPELTISPKSREIIKSALETLSLGSHLKLVVAGSWHNAEQETFINIAPVFNEWGDQIATHEKIFPYIDKLDGPEGIRPGDSLSVLVLEDALVALGICKDFAERGDPNPNPYTELDVDLILITSLGDENTMKSHRRTADQAKTVYRAASFVVQQLFPPSTSAVHPNPGPLLGYVLTPYNIKSWGMRPLKRWEPWIRSPALARRRRRKAD